MSRVTATRVPWLVAQRWENMLFAHWPVDPAQIARLLPAGVDPDVRDGTAWLGIVAFVMVGSRPCTRLRVPTLRDIPELNVRTYVRVDDVPAVWFLSLDAASRFFVTAGRALYGLRYRLALMTTVVDRGTVHYLSRSGEAAFSASYAPSARPARVRPGSLEHFLLERYRLFAERHGRLITARVAHEPWLIQTAEARIELNRMAPPGVALTGEPRLDFSHGVDAMISMPAYVHARTATEARTVVAAAH